MKLRKALSLFLANLLVLAVAPSVFADEGATTLTTTVPGPEYTLNIPADQTVAFGARLTLIDPVTITGSSGFATGKNVEVALSYSAFSCADTSTTIPRSIFMTNIADDGVYGSGETGMTLVFKGQSDGTVKQYATIPGDLPLDCDSFKILINNVDWGKADPGVYTTTVTFTAQVVNE